MVRVHIKIVGALARPLGKDDFELDCEEGTCLEELLRQAGYQAAHVRFIMTVVNGTQERPSYVLRNADSVQLFLPTSGG
jgi:molybdopterin converting factor small subunit